MSLMSLLLAVLGTIGAIVLIVGIALGSVLWRVLGKVIDNELEVAIPELARGLLEKAIARIPEDHRLRLEEEWTAGLKDPLEKRPLWALVQAASLWQKAGRIATELEPAPVPVSPGRIFEEVRKVASWVEALIESFAAFVALSMIGVFAYGALYVVLRVLGIV